MAFIPTKDRKFDQGKKFKQCALGVEEMMFHIKVLTRLKSSRFPTRAPSRSAYRDFTLQISSSLMLDFMSSPIWISHSLHFSPAPGAFSPAHQIPVRDFPVFQPDFNAGRDCRRFRCFSPDFDAWIRRLVAGWMDPAITSSSCEHYTTHHSHLLLHQHNVGAQEAYCIAQREIQH